MRCGNQIGKAFPSKNISTATASGASNEPSHSRCLLPAVLLYLQISAPLLALAHTQISNGQSSANVGQAEVNESRNIPNPSLSFVVHCGMGIRGISPLETSSKTLPLEKRRVEVTGRRSSFLIIPNSPIPKRALDAFAFAVKKWANVYSSRVRIRIGLSMESLPLDRLAGTRAQRTNDGSEVGTPGVAYNRVVASAATGYDFVTAPKPHFHVRFNSNKPWNFDTTKRAQKSQYDFVTASLHEVGHGVGFTGQIRRGSKDGHAQFRNIYQIPGRFDSFLTSGDAKGGLTGGCGHPNQTELFKSVTGRSLKFVLDPKAPSTFFTLNSPAQFKDASQVYHLSENDLKSDCKRENIPDEQCSDLLTPSFGKGYTQHSIGLPVILILESLLGASEGFTTPPSCTSTTAQ